MTCENAIPDDRKAADGWHNLKLAGRSASFVISDFDGDENAVRKAVNEQFSEPVMIECKELTLREAFVAIVQTYRNSGKEDE